MPLRHEPDVAAADWFATSDTPWRQLCSLGPSGFDRYCRLFHPVQEGASEDDADELRNVEGNLDGTHLERLTCILARHTGTPDDCFFGLWEGFGAIHGSPAVAFFGLGRGIPSRVPPAFPPEVLDGPRVQIPGRAYLLFRGRLRDAGQWGAADLVPGHPRPINSPNLIWPQDHAWFAATEIDVPWTGIAGSSSLVKELMADAVLDVEPINPAMEVPYRRQ